MKSLSIFFILTSLVYVLLHIFFEDAFIYWIGGLMGAALKLFSNNTNPVLIGIIWFILLTLFIVIHFYFKERTVKIFSIIVIGLLLYLIDFIMYSLFADKFNSEFFKYLSLLMKTIIITFIICKSYSHCVKSSELA